MVELIVRLSDLGESPVLQDLMVIGQNHILPHLHGLCTYIYTYMYICTYICTYTYIHVEVLPTVMDGRNDTVGSFSYGKKCSF